MSRREERAFLDWYLGLVERFIGNGRADYDRQVEILNVPEAIRGYAELRQEKMAQAKEKVRSLSQASRKKAIA